ncbi:MAG: hypothetical protein JXR37_35145 [Kiritimatiellae bacterium]|nr:hypothetical protein [Kiritimatiellia bacterium]
MRNGLVRLALAFLLAGAAQGAEPAAVPTVLPTDSAEYAEWLRQVNRALRDRALPPARRAAVLALKARFYEEFVGDPEQALHIWEQVPSAGPAPGSEAAQAAAQAERLRALLARHRGEKDALRTMATHPGGDEERTARVAELRRMIARCAGSPYEAGMTYYLGAYLLDLGQERAAYEAFGQALRLRPALGFSLPAPIRMQRAYRLWSVRVARRAARRLLAAWLLVAGALFGLARPWRWLGLRHALGLGVLLAVWTGCFWAGAWLIGRATDATPTATNCFVGTMPGSPMSEVLCVLFGYGLIGVLGAFAAAVATTVVPLPKTRLLLNLFLSLLLFGTLVAFFSLRHCRSAELEPAGEQGLAVARGSLRFTTEELMPFLLMDPRAYPGLALEEVDEEVLRAFVRHHYEAMRSGAGP